MNRGDVLSDEQFLRRCRVETMRGPGPGGQKRNKTSSYVRIVHLPTGLSAVAGESRSQPRNRAVAIRRLRIRLAVELRTPIDLANFIVPTWFDLAVSDRNAKYLEVLALLLDVLAACEWSIGQTRALLGGTSRQFTRFLGRSREAWNLVQRERSKLSKRPLSIE